MTGQQLKQMRVAAGISGRLVCAQARIDRSRLSDIEREYVRPSAAESARLKEAIEELTAAKAKLIALAEKCGWPVSAL
jgi:transcriptional regulator with XRE-family HTH domain